MVTFIQFVGATVNFLWPEASCTVTKWCHASLGNSTPSSTWVYCSNWTQYWILHLKANWADSVSFACLWYWLRLFVFFFLFRSGSWKCAQPDPLVMPPCSVVCNSYILLSLFSFSNCSHMLIDWIILYTDYLLCQPSFTLSDIPLPHPSCSSMFFLLYPSQFWRWVLNLKH